MSPDKASQLEAIAEELRNLEESPLYGYRTGNGYLPVTGEGDPDAKIMFIAPLQVRALLVLLTVVLSLVGCARGQAATTPTSTPFQPTATSTSFQPTPTSPPTATPGATPGGVAVATSPTNGPPGTPVKARDLFTRTNIYLVALGDDGQSGKEIGCDDSVVPVEVEIEPTRAPLTAALNELLAIGAREYGQSGLYNALYQSDLRLDSASVVDGEAMVRLSGALTLGGVCDGPRVRAQLRQTALQDPTVDRVSIFINGSPLEELLSLK